VREAGVASERARERQSAVCVVRSALPGHLRLGHSTRLSLRSKRAGWRGARRCPSLHPRHPYSLLSDDAGAATLHKWLQHRFGAKIASSGRKIAPSAGAEMNQIFRCPGNGFTTASAPYPPRRQPYPLRPAAHEDIMLVPTKPVEIDPAEHVAKVPTTLDALKQDLAEPPESPKPDSQPQSPSSPPLKVFRAKKRQRRRCERARGRGEAPRRSSKTIMQ
jgi:hypothetical protein